MATDIFLRSVPPDADQDDIRLYDPTAADAPPAGGDAVLRMMMGLGA